MTELSFGEIFNASAIDINSIVNMSHCPEAVSSIEKTITSWVGQGMGGLLDLFIYDTSVTSPIATFVDNYGNREFAYIENGNTLKVYIVDTTALTITLSSSTVLTSVGYVFYWIGIKKVGSSYCIYYAASQDVLYGHPSYMRFDKLTVVPGVSCNHTTLQSWTLPGSYYFFVADVKMIGRTGYVAWVREYTVPYQGWHVDGYIYSLDMDTEVCLGGLVHQSDGIRNIRSTGHLPGFTTDYNTKLRMMESDGILSWCMTYTWTLWAGNGAGSSLILNGVETVVSTYGYSYTDITKLQYNPHDNIFACRFYDHATNSLTIKVVNGVIGVGVLDQPSETYPTPVTFHNQAVFPAIGYQYQSGYTFVDKSTGLATSAVSLSGISAIYDIFPMQDSYSNDIYMGVLRSTVQKIISTDPVGGQVDRIYDVVLPSIVAAPNSFNHGNFFVQWIYNGPYNVSLYITYIVNLIAPKNNVIIMIPEQPL